MTLAPLDLPRFLTFSYQLNDSTSFMHASALRLVRRGLATAAAHPPHASPSSSHVTAATSAIPLSNVEAQWATLSPAEQTAVHQQLEEIQRKDWKTLSLAEKKAGASVRPLFDIVPSFPRRRVRGGRSVSSCCSYALHRTAYYVAFGPHGPRAPVNPPGTAVKILTGISVLVGTASLIYAGIRSIGVLARSIFHHIVLTSTVFLFLF